MGKSSRRPRLGAAECGEIKPPAAARRRGRARGARSPVHRAPASRLHDDQAPGPRASPACEAQLRPHPFPGLFVGTTARRRS